MSKEVHFKAKKGNFELRAYISGDWNAATISMTGAIEEEWDAQDLERYFRWIKEEGHNEVSIYANGPGGDPLIMNNIVNAIMAFDGTVHLTAGALVASAYTYLFAKVKGKGRRKGPANMQAMIHKPMMRVQGNEDEIASNAKLLGNLTKDYKAAYTQAGMFTEAELDEAWKTDYWMNAEEFRAKGFIDEIISAEPITTQTMAMLRACAAPISPTLYEQNNNDQILEHQINEMEKAVLMAKLGLPNTASDAELQAKLDAALSAEKKLAELQARLETERKEGVKLQAKALIDKAIADKKITEEYRPSFSAKFELDFEAAKNELESLKAVPTLSAELGGKKPEAGVEDARKDWTYKDWAEKDNKGLSALRNGDEKQKAVFAALFKAEYNIDYLG